MVNQIDNVMDNVDQYSSSAINCIAKFETRNDNATYTYVALTNTATAQIFYGNIVQGLYTLGAATLGYIAAYNASSSSFDDCNNSASQSFKDANRMADLEYQDCIK